MKKSNFIVFCVEKGILEQQAILLSESIKQHLAPNFKCIAFSPRENNYLTESTENKLKENGAQVLKVNLNQDFEHYPVANKLLVMQYLDSLLDFQNLIFVDTDTVFNCPIENNLIDTCNKLYLRPVDNKGPGSAGENDDNDQFWLSIFDLFKIKPPEPVVYTSVSQVNIRSYYNAGFVWINGIKGFYQQWYDDFITILKSNLRPNQYQSRDGNDFRCLDQVALAVTAERYKSEIEILPKTYNYPIPFRPLMKTRDNQPSFDQLVHIHYHKWFQHPEFLDHVTTEDEKNCVQYLWLKQYLPLEPLIDSEFKC